MSWWKYAKPGDKVVLARDFDRALYARFTPYPAPAYKEPVTISWIGDPGSGLIHIDLVEYPLQETAELLRGYKASWFRPLETRKPDISIFRELLNNPHKQLEGV